MSSVLLIQRIRTKSFLNVSLLYIYWDERDIFGWRISKHALLCPLGYWQFCTQPRNHVPWIFYWGNKVHFYMQVYRQMLQKRLVESTSDAGDTFQTWRNQKTAAPSLPLLVLPVPILKLKLSDAHFIRYFRFIYQGTTLHQNLPFLV